MRRAEAQTLVATVLGSGLAFLDLASVTVLLPVLQREFDAPLRDVQWVVEAFLLFLAALILLGGGLGDRYGRRRIFRHGVVVFGLASLAAAVAPTVWTLVAARAFQGVGAALIVPSSLALIAQNVPAERRGAAYGIWTAMTGVAVTGGPVLAGALADAWTWRAFFFLNVPLALLVLAALARVPDVRPPDGRRLDVLGAGLAVVTLGGITLSLLEAPMRGWDDPWVGAAMGAGAAAAVLFVVAEAKQRDPMVPLGLFRIRAFWGFNAVTLLIYAALSGVLFLVPFNLIQVQGWSATAAGAAIAPTALLLVVLSGPMGRVSDRIGPRWPVAIGSLLCAQAYVLLALPGAGADYWTGFLPGFLVLGVGMAMLVPGLTATVMGSVPATRTGAASGINNAVARTAGLLAVALFGLVAVGVFGATLPDPVRDALGPDVNRLAEAEPPPGVAPHVIADAFVHAFRAVMLVAATLCAAGALLAWATAPMGRLGTDPADTERTAAGRT